jgi:phosphoglycerate dehydrogenase-like enzyme
LHVTNAKGQFSSSLAEYAMMACSYFAKDLPRLMRNQKNKVWDNYDIEELRGKTLGIVGYGDVGRACAKLATVYGMRIVALRRHPFLSKDDPYCDTVYGRDKQSLNQLMSESDYILCSAPSTVDTLGMVNALAFEHVKENAVFINLGRGPVVDEKALIKALKSRKLKGAALDVFVDEPLPLDNELWELDNVLISPHNMDQTSTFMHEATEFFVNENLPRFICGEDLLNKVDIEDGY